MNNTTCGACDPLLVSSVNEFWSLYCNDDESPPNLCNCSVRLRVLNLANCGLRSVPHGMDNLIHLRWLDLCRNILSTEDLKIIFRLYYLQTLHLWNCCLEEIPKEIENLSELRHLNLSDNELKELPSGIGNLKQLRHLDLSKNTFSKELPSDIGKLTLLHTFKLPFWEIQCRMPEGLAQLTGLQTLIGFEGGGGWSKLGLLKNLNQLGVVRLYINLDGKDLRGMIEDARKAELSNKMHILQLELIFVDEMDEKEESPRMDVIDAMTPHPNLRLLYIWGYKGSRLPLWIVSPTNQLKKVDLYYCNLTSLPSLGKLPCLEEIHVYGNRALEFVGREFLGLTTNTNFVAFPKLITLKFQDCGKWKEWEDITEEEESAAFQVMPCLTELEIRTCDNMALLPHRLLRKASLLETLYISRLMKLVQRYGNKDGSDWKSISRNNPRLQRW